MARYFADLDFQWAAHYYHDLCHEKMLSDVVFGKISSQSSLDVNSSVVGLIGIKF